MRQAIQVICSVKPWIAFPVKVCGFVCLLATIIISHHECALQEFYAGLEDRKYLTLPDAQKKFMQVSKHWAPMTLNHKFAIPWQQQTLNLLLL